MKRNLLTRFSPDAKRAALNYLRNGKRRDEHSGCVFRRPERSRWCEERQRTVYYGTAIEHANKNCEHAWPNTGCCKHGVYVGGCGVDWMCGRCEMGISDYEIALGEARAFDERRKREFVDKTYTMLVAASARLPMWATKQMCTAWVVLIGD